MPRTSATYRTRLSACASSNDGDNRVTMIDADVLLSFPPLDHTDPDYGLTLAEQERQAEQFGRWVDMYLAGRDLSGVLKFAPLPRFIADHLHAVAASLAPYACRVALRDGAVEWTVEN